MPSGTSNLMADNIISIVGDAKSSLRARKTIIKSSTIPILGTEDLLFIPRNHILACVPKISSIA